VKKDAKMKIVKQRKRPVIERAKKDRADGVHSEAALLKKVCSF
jgi:hypothetical protein